MQTQTQILLFTRSTSFKLENVINFQPELDYRIINSDGCLIFMLICILFSFPFNHRVPPPFHPSQLIYSSILSHPKCKSLFVEKYQNYTISINSFQFAYWVFMLVGCAVCSVCENIHCFDFMQIEMNSLRSFYCIPSMHINITFRASHETFSAKNSK